MAIELTKDQLKKCLPFASEQNINRFLTPLNETFKRFEINTAIRVAAFLAQVAHESGSLKYVRELASGEAYDTGNKAASLGNTPEDDGDGERYKGRGLIQITGRINYKQVGTALEYNFIDHPEALELPGAAAMSAGWYWKSRGLNELADQNTEESFKQITKKINGGFNGLLDRQMHWNKCKKALML